MTLDTVLSDTLLNNAQLGAAGLALLHFVWQGALLALGLALLLRALRPERAGLRYALACVTLLLMAAAPLATFGGLYEGSSPVSSSATRLEPLASEGETASETRGDGATTPSTTLTPVSSVASTGETARPLGLSYVPFAPLNVGRVAPYVTLLWGLGVLFLALRLLGGVWVSARLGRKGRLAPVHYQQRLLELSRRLGLKRPVRLLESRAVAVPVVAGLLKPVILLPTSALTGLSPLQLEMILAHELAHVRRRDPLVNALQHLVETALFYHPAVWWVSNVVREEREACCDAVATRLCGNPLAYAETLARLERLRGPGPLVLAASGGRLKARIERLLGLRSAPTGSPLVTFGLALGLVGLLGVAGVMAQSGGATLDASPVSPTLPERSLWVNILGDVTFTDDYSGVADVGVNGLFVLEERLNSKPYRLLVVTGNGDGTPDYTYVKEGTFELERGTSTFDSFTVEGSLVSTMLDPSSLATNHPEIAQWLEDALEQTVARETERSAATTPGEDPLASLASAVGFLANGDGYYSLLKEISPGVNGPLTPLSQMWGTEMPADVSGVVIFGLWRALHYLTHNLTTDEDVVAFIRDVIENYADNLAEVEGVLMLEVAAEFRTESAKADALVAVAGVLPEDAALRAEYRRVALTLEDESLRRKALDALQSSQGSVPGLEVVLDAGHGGALGGASGYADEDAVALAVAEKVAARLEAAGVRVVVTREEDATLGSTPEEDLDARLAHITPDTDAFISLHANASDDPLTGGIETFLASEFETGELEAATLELAEGLQAGLAGTGASDRGVKRSPYDLLKQASVPAVIIELGFVTNPKEGAKLASETYQDTLAEAISRAVLAFLRVNPQPNLRGSVPGLADVHGTLAETMNRARLLLPHAEDAPFGNQNSDVQPLYGEARAHCTGERFEGRTSSDASFTMLAPRPDADTEFFIEPGFDELIQTCVRRFVADPDFRERLKNPSEKDFLLGRWPQRAVQRTPSPPQSVPTQGIVRFINERPTR